ncbi:MAG: hypothetical protein AB1499_16525, partial [Nitrospirota bacterium]
MNIKKKYNIEELLFRRQFILGPYFMDAFPSWNKIKISDLFCLTVHPELNVSQTVQGDKSITLLGFILDPDNEQARDKDILNDLMQKLNAHESLDSFFQYTYPLGGRWILIVDNGKRTVLFHDPMGLREVFFTNRHFEKELWC